MQDKEKEEKHIFVEIWTQMQFKEGGKKLTEDKSSFCAVID